MRSAYLSMGDWRSWRTRSRTSSAPSELSVCFGVCVCVCADTRALLLSSLAFNDLTDEIGPTLIALLPKLNKLQLIKCAARSLRLASS
jgi:hypothetical protein